MVNKKNGFTLVEMSIVLIIAGIIASFALNLFHSSRDKALAKKAENDVLSATYAVIGNTLKNSNTLPSYDFFQKNLTPVKNSQKALEYIDDPALESIDVCSYKSTVLKIKTPSKTIDNVAFAVISPSANENMQTGLSDNGDGTYSLKTYEYENKVDDNTSPINRAEYYDDKINWVTLDELKKELRCGETGLRFLNDTNLLDGDSSSKYKNSSIYVDGGTSFSSGGKYKYCAQYSPLDNPNSWLQANCDGTQYNLEADCSTATYHQCDNFSLQGKNGAVSSAAGIHKIITFVKDQADSPVQKSFIIKVN